MDKIQLVSQNFFKLNCFFATLNFNSVVDQKTWFLSYYSINQYYNQYFFSSIVKKSDFQKKIIIKKKNSSHERLSTQASDSYSFGRGFAEQQTISLPKLL